MNSVSTAMKGAPRTASQKDASASVVVIGVIEML
jgi:hypothetical protein